MTRKKLIFWSLAAYGLYYFMKHRAAAPAALPNPGASQMPIRPLPGLTLVSNTGATSGGASGSW